MRTMWQALRLAWSETAARRSGLFSFVILVTLYAFTLPASLTGGFVGWVSLRLLTPQLALMALALALPAALTVSLMVSLLRQGGNARGATLAGGTLLGLVTPLLCCSPIIPLALGALATLAPTAAAAASGRLQGFIATHETVLLLAALGLMVLALYQNARRVVAGAHCRVPRHRP